MDQSGEYQIAANREVVWQALNDPEVLGACIAGCQGVNAIDDEHFDVKVKAKVGPVSAVFQAQLTLHNLVPPESYSIDGQVKGGAAGFAKGSADVALQEAGDDGEATLLTYTVKANVGGKLAQVGSRLVDGAARKMADDFFAAFSSRLSPATEEATEEATEATDEAQTPQDGPASDTAPTGAPEYEKSGNGMIWGIAFLVLALAIALAL